MRIAVCVIAILLLVGCSGIKSQLGVPQSQSKSTGTYTMWSDSAHHPYWQGFASPLIDGWDHSNNYRASAQRIENPELMSTSPEASLLQADGKIWGSPVANWIPRAISVNPERTWVSYRVYTLSDDTGVSTLAAYDPEFNLLKWTETVAGRDEDNHSSPLTTRAFALNNEPEITIDPIDERWVFAAGSDGTLTWVIDFGDGVGPFSMGGIPPPDGVYGTNVYGSPSHGPGSGLANGRYNGHNVLYTSSNNNGSSNFYCRGFTEAGMEEWATPDDEESYALTSNWDTTSTPAIVNDDGYNYPDARAFIIEYKNGDSKTPAQGRLKVIDVHTGATAVTLPFDWYGSTYCGGVPSRVSPVIDPNYVYALPWCVLVSTPDGVLVYTQTGMTMNLVDSLPATAGWDTVSMPVTMTHPVQYEPGEWVWRSYMYTIEQRLTPSPQWRVRAHCYYPSGPDWYSSTVDGVCWSQPYVDQNGYVYVADTTKLYGWKSFDLAAGQFNAVTTPGLETGSFDTANQSSVCCPFVNIPTDYSGSRLFVGNSLGYLSEYAP